MRGCLITIWDMNLAREDMHSSQLCQMISDKYFDIRLFSHAKFYNESVINKGKIDVRQQSNMLNIQGLLKMHFSKFLSFYQ